MLNPELARIISGGHECVKQPAFSVVKCPYPLHPSGGPMRSRSAIQTVVTVAVLLSLSCTCSALSALAPATETPTPTNTPAPADTRAPTDTPVPTDTPIPTATFTPVPNPGDVLLHDIFTDNGNNWQTFSDAEADGGFAN